ncbi:IS4 family transposase [Pectobacterium colocasium]|uniref:IS4 family transposase n=1 Tax=Pectobacterium colocasium TaxID=2878098 RepID=UPI001CD5F52F|nr:IS4 family transposase [Pectobacterium colocasium]
MQLSQALGIINLTAPEQIHTLADLLPVSMIEQALTLTDTVTLRKRKLPLESMVWLVIGMAVFNQRPLSHIVNLMDIADRSGTPFIAPSSVIQRRQTLGEAAVRELFDITQRHWNEQAQHPQWHGLNLFAVDGVVWQTQDTPENEAAFGKASNQHGDKGYPQVRMACLMELSSHLITASAFGRYDVNEMRLAAELTGKTPDNSITLFDKGFYSVGLLHHWRTAGENRHWLLPLKKNTQYEVISKLGRQDRLVRIKTSPQARKQWATLPESITARLLTKMIEGKTREVLTSLTDPMRYPAAEVNALYAHRWEIELGYREAKQGLLGNRWHLRSRLPEMVRQELWGVLLTYNLVRYQMVKMAFTLKGDYLPYQLSFSGALTEIWRLLIGLPGSSPGAIPGHLKHFYEQAIYLVLPLRRERSYPREIRGRRAKYPLKNNAGHLK